MVTHYNPSILVLAFNHNVAFEKKVACIMLIVMSFNSTLNGSNLTILSEVNPITFVIRDSTINSLRKPIS